MPPSTKMVTSTRRLVTISKKETTAPTPQKVRAVAKDPQTSTTKVASITKNGASKEQNEWISYAFARCGIDCVTTWQAESGWVLDRKGNTANKDGSRDYGECQMNSRYHASFIFANGKNGAYSKDFLDPYKQLDRCIGIWNDAANKGRLKTTFYAYNVRNTPGVVNAFTFHY